MTSVLEILTEIKDIILAALPNMDNGFAYCRQDETKGLVATPGNDMHYVGINDTEGDYFYIRENGITRFASRKSTTDCYIAVDELRPYSLVAVVKEADEFRLSDAIKNELLKTKVVELTGEENNPVKVIDTELKGLKAESIQAAKSRIGERTIVRIDFNLRRPFQTENCKYNICKTC